MGLSTAAHPTQSNILMTVCRKLSSVLGIEEFAEVSVPQVVTVELTQPLPSFKFLVLLKLNYFAVNFADDDVIRS